MSTICLTEIKKRNLFELVSPLAHTQTTYNNRVSDRSIILIIMNIVNKTHYLRRLAVHGLFEKVYQ